MATIKDSVHDHIEVTGPPEALLDTPAVQRLRRIRQLGTAQFVYPSANHTRFEHSLGVYHLASRAAERLDLPERDVAHVEAAALLHDVGHGPFSHNIEALTHRRTGKYHDEVEELIASGRVGETLRDHDLDPGRIARLIRGEGKYGQLVSGELDVDRMDYLVRDAHHTGVPYGTIDHERLTRELTFVDGELVLDEGNVQTAESLLLARALMNPTVYKHHVARISKAMLRRASERLLDSENGAAADVDAERLRRMDDHDLIVALRSTPETESFSRRFDARRLLKRSVWAEWTDVPGWVLDAGHQEIRQIERAIADEADVEPTDVIVDVPPEPSITESSSRVLVSGEMRRLDEQSPLVSALRTAQKGQWRLGVYTRRELTDRVGRIAARKLDIDVDGGLVTDVRTNVYHTLDEFER